MDTGFSHIEPTSRPLPQSGSSSSSALPRDPASDAKAGAALLRLLAHDGSIGDPDVVRGFSEACEAVGLERVIAVARKASLSPLLYRQAKRAGLFRDRTDSILESLRLDYATSFARAMRMEMAILPVLEACSSHGIKVIVLKGFYLGWNIYGDPALRPMSDIDILVEKPRIAQVMQIFSDSGYKTNPGTEGMMANHLPPMISASGVCVELHHSIMDTDAHPGCDPGALFARALPVRFRSVHAWALSPEDQILHLCEHILGHHMLSNGMRGFVDIVRIIDQHTEAIDWRVLAQRARSWKIDRMLSLCLHLCRHYALFDLPDAYRGIPELAPLEDCAAIRDAESLLFDPGQGEANALTRLKHARSPFARSAVLLERLFLPPATLRVIMSHSAEKSVWPFGTLPFLYVRRLAYLVRRHGSVVFATKPADKAPSSQDSHEEHDSGDIRVLRMDRWLKNG